MQKKMFIEGMSCGHCSARVEKALGAVEGVGGVTVSLEDKCADIELVHEVADDVLRSAVTDAGYEVISIEGQ